MKKLLPIVVFIGIVFFFFKPFIVNGLLPIPSDNLVGLYNPYRDFYAKEYPRGIPYKNFLISDPVEQQYPWRQLAVGELKELKLPLWNPYNFSGTPLLANGQSAPFYPLNILFFLLPFPFAWSVLVLLQPILGGIFMYIYLQKIKLSKASCFLGSIVFSFSGFSMVWMEWNIIVQTIIWLPFILFIKETLLEKFSLKWAIALSFAELCAFLGGHLQTWFYLICVTNAYLLYRIATESKVSVTLFIKKHVPFLVIGIFFLAVILTLLFPLFQFIHLSGREIDLLNWQTAGWFIPWQQLITFLIPDFYGNPASLNYWGIWNYMEFALYIGIIPVMFSLLALFRYKNKFVLFYILLLIVSILFAFPTPLAKIPFILQIPFLSTSQPTRLTFLIDFSLAILAAFGMEQFLEKTKRIYISIGIIGIFFIAVWGNIIFVHKFIFPISLENLQIAKRNLSFSTLLFVASTIALISSVIFSKSRKIFLLSIILLLGISSFDLIRFGQKFTSFTSPSYLYPNAKAISFLKEHIGNYRYMTTDRQILPPNVSSIYKLQSLDGYDPLYLLSYGEFIAAMERNQPNITPPFGFNRIITPHNSSSPFINLLGVKYVVSLAEIQNPSLNKVFTEGQTKIYENANVMPRAFSVKKIYPTSSKQEAMNLLYHFPNFTDNAVVQNYSGPKEFGRSSVMIIAYSENQVTLRVFGENTSFVVLTDINYPIWHATIDSKETKIFTTDYLFRGIIVPKGDHVITFKSSIL